jgi:uncharacterized phage-associated protein
MFDARIIANAVLDRADARGRAITNLDLQKIVYFLHGHFLKRHNKPLVDGEFEAWPYGPVHRVLYDAFKSYNDTPIEGRATAFDPIRRKTRDLPILEDNETVTLMDDVLDFYLELTTSFLVRLTHESGTPWSRTVEGAEKRVNAGMKIPDDLILNFFEGPAGKPRRASPQRTGRG